MIGNTDPFTAFDCRETVSDKHVETHDYGLVDSMNRRVGCRIVTWDASFHISEEETTWEHNKFRTRERAERILAECVARGLFGLWNQQTRDGKVYGAHQPDRYFPTLEARDAAIAKYLKQGRATAEKSVAKKVAEKSAHAAWRARRGGVA